MPQPSTAMARAELGAIASEVMRDAGASSYIGLRVLPIFNSGLQSGEYPIITRESMLKLHETLRAPKSGYNRADWTFDLDNFTCQENGWEEVIDDAQAKKYKNLFTYEEMLTRRAIAIILRKQEKRIADAVFNTSTFTPVVLTHEWDDSTNAVPITDVQTGKIAFKDATGLNPDTLIIAHSTFLNLGTNAQIIARVLYTNPGVGNGELTKELIAAALGVERLLVGDAYYDSADDGLAASMTGIWSNEYAMLCRTAKTEDLEDPALGRTFLWTEDSGTGEAGTVVEEYRDESVRSTIIRVRHQTTEKIICAGVGYLMSNVTT